MMLTGESIGFQDGTGEAICALVRARSTAVGSFETELADHRVD
jgi:hypothetical protein